MPDLTIEIISPSDRDEEVHDKLVEYFRFGVRQVWLVRRKQRWVNVYDSPTDVRILTPKDTLDAGPVLPGFRITVAGLFGWPAT